MKNTTITVIETAKRAKIVCAACKATWICSKDKVAARVKRHEEQPIHKANCEAHQR